MVGNRSTDWRSWNVIKSDVSLNREVKVTVLHCIVEASGEVPEATIPPAVAHNFNDRMLTRIHQIANSGVLVMKLHPRALQDEQRKTEKEIDRYRTPTHTRGSRAVEPHEFGQNVVGACRTNLRYF